MITGAFSIAGRRNVYDSPDSSTSSENKEAAMKWYSAIVFAIGTAFSVALAIYPKHAPAQEVLTGRGIICDTAEQVARVQPSFFSNANSLVMWVTPVGNIGR
jgi:hypothetical protein